MSLDNTLKVNKHSLFKYSQEEKLEAGIVLKGLDVKDFKSHNFEIRDSVINIEVEEAYIYNIHLKSSPEAPQKRKLLFSKKEIIDLQKTLQNKRMHAYVIRAYLNARGIVKLQVGIGTIKKKSDHRSSEKRTSEKRMTEKYISENS